LDAETEATIEDEGDRWALLLASGSITRQQRDELDAWVDAHPDHRRALADAQEALKAVDRARNLSASRELKTEIIRATRAKSNRAFYLVIALAVALFALLWLVG
jgi:ferric-dicitrate binding protein FerR (iron transport regulator)